MNPAARCLDAQYGTLPAWSAEADDELLCVGTREETADVRSFFFAGRPASRFHYLPGQFLTFDFVIDGEIVNRCYTMASSPTRPDLVSITVKRKPGGVVSPWLHAHLRPGMIVRATGPIGEFSFVPAPASKYLFLSGGSGITPLMSMTRTHHDLAPDADILFVHFARSPADIIFRGELALMSQQMPQLRVIVVCETDTPDETWGGVRGRIGAPMLELIAPDLAERSVFDCGPAPFMRAVRDSLARLGFDMRRYHEESFDFGIGPETVPETLPDIAPPEIASAAGFTVTFAKSGRSITVRAGEHVLTAARAAGMRLPSSCTKGMCGTCKSKMLSGTVDMQHQGGIRQREIDQGQILLCCSTPLSDLVIER